MVAAAAAAPSAVEAGPKRGVAPLPDGSRWPEAAAAVAAIAESAAIAGAVVPPLLLPPQLRVAELRVAAAVAVAVAVAVAGNVVAAYHLV